jgi:hypothetical protein
VPDFYTAGDVPALRRNLADWYGGPQSVEYYRLAIDMGKQHVRPAGPAGPVAARLAALEAERLREGDLWYLDEDLCALLAAAHPGMPPFAALPHDLPSKFGFAVFAEPIALYDAGESRVDNLVDALGDEATGEAATRLYEHDVRIIAVSWGPYQTPSWRAGGVWMSFYSPSNIEYVVDEDTARRARAILPPLTVDNEYAGAWRPDGAPVDSYLLHGGEGQDGTARWARLVFAAFQLAVQQNLAESQPQATPRPERRRTQRAGLPPRDVRIIRLRRAVTAAREAEQQGGSGRDWQHRWVVRGHWRNHWYPKMQDHRPKWIAPYLKGPDGAPLIGGDKVTVVTAQPDEPASNINPTHLT